jgi:hypothetical protein
MLVGSLPVEEFSNPTKVTPRYAGITPHPLDYAPDFSKDPFPPWPDIYNPDGSNISVQNWRGTKLFGWKGCKKPERDMIAQAFRDFYKLSQQKQLWDGIDWEHQASKEFWGKSDDDRKKVQDDRKMQIERRRLCHFSEDLMLTLYP